MSVVLEVFVKGQVTKATKFWSSLKKLDLTREAKSAFPFLSMMVGHTPPKKMIDHVLLIRSFISIFIAPVGVGDEKPLETCAIDESGDVVRWSARFCTRCDRRHAGCVLCFLPEVKRAVLLGLFFVCTHTDDTEVAKVATERAGDVLRL